MQLHMYAASVSIMKHAPVPPESPAYGETLKERRRLLRKSLMFVENETDGAVNTALVSRLENGLKRPSTLKPKQLEALAIAYEWSVQHLADVLQNRRSWVQVLVRPP